MKIDEYSALVPPGHPSLRRVNERMHARDRFVFQINGKQRLLAVEIGSHESGHSLFGVRHARVLHVMQVLRQISLSLGTKKLRNGNGFRRHLDSAISLYRNVRRLLLLTPLIVRFVSLRGSRHTRRKQT